MLQVKVMIFNVKGQGLNTSASTSAMGINLCVTTIHHRFIMPDDIVIYPV